MHRLAALLLIAFTLPVAADGSAPAAAPTDVILKTSLGTIEIELAGDRAPLSTANFLQYVTSGFYDGTIFHRVIPGFVIQGGGFTTDMTRKETRAPIRNEADNGLSNKRGTIAMARTRDPDSATSQFFINLADNSMLDFHSKDAQGWGYAVFGHVVRGMDVVDKIAAVPTTVIRGMEDVPEKPVLLLKATARMTAQ